MLSPQAGWAVGYIAGAMQSQYAYASFGYFLKYEQGEWHGYISKDLEHPYTLYMTTEKDGWVLGYRHGEPSGTHLPFILRCDDGLWEEQPLPDGAYVHSLCVLPDENAWAVGNCILRYVQGHWVAVQEVGSDTLSRLSMISAQEGWGFGTTGNWRKGNGNCLVMHYKDGAWVRLELELKGHIVMGQMLSSDEGWAVSWRKDESAWEGRRMYSGESTILHYSNGTWSPELNVDGKLRIKMLSSTDGWAYGEYYDRSGYRPLVMRYRDGTWTKVVSDVFEQEGLNDLHMTSADEGWGAGSNNILHCHDGVWSPSIYAGSGENYDGLFRGSVNVLDNGEAWMKEKSDIIHYKDGEWSRYDIHNIDFQALPMKKRE